MGKRKPKPSDAAATLPANHVRDDETPWLTVSAEGRAEVEAHYRRLAPAAFKKSRQERYDRLLFGTNYPVGSAAPGFDGCDRPTRVTMHFGDIRRTALQKVAIGLGALTEFVFWLPAGTFTDWPNSEVVFDPARVADYYLNDPVGRISGRQFYAVIPRQPQGYPPPDMIGRYIEWALHNKVWPTFADTQDFYAQVEARVVESGRFFANLADDACKFLTLGGDIGLQRRRQFWDEVVAPSGERSGAVPDFELGRKMMEGAGETAASIAVTGPTIATAEEHKPHSMPEQDVSKADWADDALIRFILNTGVETAMAMRFARCLRCEGECRHKPRDTLFSDCRRWMESHGRKLATEAVKRHTGSNPPLSRRLVEKAAREAFGIIYSGRSWEKLPCWNPSSSKGGNAGT